MPVAWPSAVSSFEEQEFRSAASENRTRRVLTGTLCLFAAGLGLMVWLGIYAFLWKTAILPLLVLAALLSGRLNRFIDDWAVFLALVILFDFCRGLVFALTTRFELPIHMIYVIDLERMLCAGHIFPVVLQHLRAALPDPAPFDRLLTVAHGSHFAFFLLFGLAVWLLRGDQFAKYSTAVALLLYVGLLFYLAVPTVPPWMASAQFGVIPPVDHIAGHVYNTTIPAIQWAFDINPVAAMPSLHAALPILCAMVGIRLFGTRGLLLAAYTALVCVAILYLGEHYLVDVLAGALLASIVYVLVFHCGLSVSGPAWGRWEVHPVLVAALLITVAEGLGQVTSAIGRPLIVTRAFVERELAENPALMHYQLGRMAFASSHFSEAEVEFRQAATAAAGRGQRKLVAVWLARAAYRRNDYDTVLETLQPLQAGDPGPDTLVLLAVTYLKSGREEDGLRLLEDLETRFPADPEPSYWLVRHRYARHQATRDDVMRLVAHIDALPATRRNGHLRSALLGLLQNPS
jgi:membrane-associated phospholipid phosphatase